MLDIIPANIVAVMVNVIVLFLVLRWLLLKPVSQFMEKRRQIIKDDLDSAKRDKEEAQRLLDQYNQLLARGKEEAAKIIETAVRQADERREELIAKAQAEAAAMLERAKVEISQAQAKAIAELRSEIVTLSVAVAEKLLAHSVTEMDQDKIFNQVLGELDASYEKYSS